MTDLETLRPEVMEAAAKLDDFDSAFGTGGHWQIIRAELLRLASDDCGLHEALCEHDELCEQFTAMRLRAERAEAELAALKVRIAGAPVGVPGYDAHPWMTIDDDVMPPEWEGKRVRLVVEE